MINNRQAGRRRGRGNNNNGGGGGQRQGGGGGGGGGGRPDTGNRIDSRARGNASQLYEKYKTLARDAQMQGDRVNIEYYLQFADHYFRVLSEQRSRFEESQPQQQQQPRRQQPFDIDGDDDYGDEGEPIRQGEQQGQSDGNRQDGRQDARQANGNGQDREERQPRYEQRGDGQRGETQQRPARNRDDNRDAQARDMQAREGQARDTQNGQAREPREERPRAEYGDTQPRELPRRAPRAAVAQPVEADQGYSRAAVTPANDAADAQPAQEEQPRRRGRPRRDRSAEDGAPVEAAPAALDADRLPPSLGISASAKPVAIEGEEKPRRRRIRAAETDEATQTG